MVVGLTGGIGAGKTTVLDLFRNIGVPVYQADVEAKKIMMSSEAVKKDIIRLLGEDAYENNLPNRAYIAEKVFADKALLQKLNEIVHPIVHLHLKAFILKQDSPYVVYENAILFENKREEFCDKVIVVVADLEDRITRVVNRDQVNREDVMRRINNQWSQEKKVKRADYVIKNNNRKDLKTEVLTLHQNLLESCDV
ncbi:MAG: dephospho-CoA kinase [Wenyingzhuangia sp.]|jgi:dephospho-CoA kinase|uniref:dephospho-CoA kinase n=1 Tax=Wenyingzhuangia sp. TaxID=1964193 RepID=UPI00321A891D